MFTSWSVVISKLEGNWSLFSINSKYFRKYGSLDMILRDKANKFYSKQVHSLLCQKCFYFCIHYKFYWRNYTKVLDTKLEGKGGKDYAGMLNSCRYSTIRISLACWPTSSVSLSMQGSYIDWESVRSSEMSIKTR